QQQTGTFRRTDIFPALESPPSGLHREIDVLSSRFYAGCQILAINAKERSSKASQNIQMYKMDKNILYPPHKSYLYSFHNHLLWYDLLR
ncbi:MAG: hypothetical protein ABFC92_05915, partial [Rectinema sp.]